MKCRVAVTDRLPNGPMRVALSVGSTSDRFGRQLVDLIKSIVPEAHPNFLSGASRGRETLIRVDAREFPQELISVSWKKQAIDDFAKFNEVHY